jgi:hypothetical protein
MHSAALRMITIMRYAGSLDHRQSLPVLLNVDDGMPTRPGTVGTARSWELTFGSLIGSRL